MLLEAGSIVEGKITGITPFGAFVALEEGQTGLVHISEISRFLRYCRKRPDCCRQRLYRRRTFPLYDYD